MYLFISKNIPFHRIYSLTSSDDLQTKTDYIRRCYCSALQADKTFIVANQCPVSTKSVDHLPKLNNPVIGFRQLSIDVHSGLFESDGTYENYLLTHFLTLYNFFLTNFSKDANTKAIILQSMYSIYLKISFYSILFFRQS